MVIQLPDGRTHAVHFHYHKQVLNLKYGDRTEPQEVRAVTVTIHEGKCPENRPRGQACPAPTSFSGVALCSPLDKWNQDTGRTLAFRRALENSGAFTDPNLVKQFFFAWSASRGGTKLKFVEVTRSGECLTTGKVVANNPKQEARRGAETAA